MAFYYNGMNLKRFAFGPFDVRLYRSREVQGAWEVNRVGLESSKMIGLIVKNEAGAWTIGFGGAFSGLEAAATRLLEVAESDEAVGAVPTAQEEPVTLDELAEITEAAAPAFEMDAETTAAFIEDARQAEESFLAEVWNEGPVLIECQEDYESQRYWREQELEEVHAAAAYRRMGDWQPFEDFHADRFSAKFDM